MTHIVGSYWSRSRSAARRIKSIETKPGFLSRLWRWARITHLRWEIEDDENWLRLCLRNGYEEPALRSRIGEKRVRLAILESGR